jgi:multidrug transporter EmrE-like cation transporter
MTAFAQVLLKMGSAASRDAVSAAQGTLLSSYQAMLSAPPTLLGLALYGASALLWLRVLSALQLSQAYPFVALSYVLTTGAGIVVLGEPLVATRVAGTVLILLGVLLVGYR